MVFKIDTYINNSLVTKLFHKFRFEPHILLDHGVLELHMNTGGGEVEPALFNFVDIVKRIKALGVKVVCVNCGEVASAGVEMFMLGDDRYMLPESTFMIHHMVWSRNLTPKNLFDTKFYTKYSSDFFNENFNLNSKQIATLDEGCELWFSGYDECEKVGFVNKPLDDLLES